jgi:hypothetical protein
MTHPHPRALEAAALAVAEETDRDGRDYYALKLARAAVTAYLAEAGDGWLPIETAPKDEVLLYFPKAIQGAHRQSFLPPMYRVGRVSDTPNRKPTHWMPLPAPPAAQEKK